MSFFHWLVYVFSLCFWQRCIFWLFWWFPRCKGCCQERKCPWLSSYVAVSSGTWLHFSVLWRCDIKPWWPILVLTINTCLFKHWKPLENPESSSLVFGMVYKFVYKLCRSLWPTWRGGEQVICSCMRGFLSFLVHLLVLPTDFMIRLWPKTTMVSKESGLKNV